MNQGPAQKVRYPNVAFSTMKQFEKDLDKWFGRKNIPIWITEYGNETKPGEPKGVTEAQQAAYVPQAIAFAKKDPRIPMFIWFVFRDSAGSPWQSGVYRTSGAAKPAAARWAAAAKTIDQLNGKLTVKGGTANPLVNVNYRDMCANNVPGTTIGVTWRAVLGNSNIPAALGQTSTTARVRLHDHGPPHRPRGREGPAPTEPRSPRTRPPHRPSGGSSRSSVPSRVASCHRSGPGLCSPGGSLHDHSEEVKAEAR